MAQNVPKHFLLIQRSDEFVSSSEMIKCLEVLQVFIEVLQMFRIVTMFRNVVNKDSVGFV